MSDLGDNLKDQIKGQLDSFLNDLTGDLKLRMVDAVNDLAIIADRALLMPEKAEEHKRDAAHVYNRIDSIAALAQLNGANRLREAARTALASIMTAVLAEV